MAHFAKLDDNNNVLEVHVVANATLDANNEETSGIAFLTEWSGGYTNWKQTSYNGTFRKRYASVNMFYDASKDAFIPIKCHDEAIFDEDYYAWNCTNATHILILEA